MPPPASGAEITRPNSHFGHAKNFFCYPLELDRYLVGARALSRADCGYSLPWTDPAAVVKALNACASSIFRVQNLLPAVRLGISVGMVEGQLVEKELVEERFVQELTSAQGQLLAYVSCLLGNVHDANTVLQETNLVIWRKVKEYPTIRSFTGWSREIAYFQALAFLRDRKRDKLIFSQEVINKIAEERDEVDFDERRMAHPRLRRPTNRAQTGPDPAALRRE